ncbi:type I-E CRISPR-associated endonuclease Cas1e [Azospirillum sp. BE72]|uniref:type I-E CRISPR-associated endonuclease Cas1e n=1 Tax=Azospirillum sp. BE72 TaxID=2817776 RepID=UPI00285B8F68|nr:type I-E CRISPR-associated endonuclease Cas1e [Azospirillum sp. BE72]MDR6771505.1 CRISPR-associated protein Cas1 [Azospirillum sp. BE72]
MLKGRLGLETARVPHVDRHGLIGLAHGRLYVEDGTLRFRTAGTTDLPPGDYALPYQGLSLILLGPGTTVSHDALRLAARHGTGLLAVGEDGTRLYASLPGGADDSRLARRQARLWADAEGSRLFIARRLYAWRLGEVLPHRDIAVLRGIEGERMKALYRRLSEEFGITWRGRRYDRANPQGADLPNQAINHAASAVEAAAAIAVAATSTLAPLGFIHEDSANAFTLDIADLFRDAATIPLAFAAVRNAEREPSRSIEAHVRKLAGRMFREKELIPSMIDRIKELFADDPDRGGDP